MGFFNKVFSDVSEIGSTKSRFKKKFTALSKLLSDYSYGDNLYSSDLSVQKIRVAHQELIEYGQIANENDIIKIYFRDTDVDLTVGIALLVADMWVDGVLNDGVLFTNTYMKATIGIFV